MTLLDIWLPEDIIRIAKNRGVSLTHQEAESILNESNHRIKNAMLNAAHAEITLILDEISSQH